MEMKFSKSEFSTLRAHPLWKSKFPLEVEIPSESEISLKTNFLQTDFLLRRRILCPESESFARAESPKRELSKERILCPESRSP